jgi:thiamine-phosphate pyrophosphorylase
VKRLGTPPFICLITEGRTNPDNFSSRRSELLRNIRDAVSDGVNIVQIRERDLPARSLFELVREVVTDLEDSGALVLVNDRADIAVAAGADGVHLRESSLSPAVIRDCFPPHLVVGVSTHSPEGARSAVEGGADFVFFGPVFDSPGKGSPTGNGELSKVCRAVADLPVIALGGINGENVASVFEAGANGVAGIRSMHDRPERRRIVGAISAAGLRLR